MCEEEGRVVFLVKGGEGVWIGGEDGGGGMGVGVGGWLGAGHDGGVGLMLRLRWRWGLMGGDWMWRVGC